MDTASMRIAVADMAQVVAPDTAQSPRQASPEDEEDLLKHSRLVAPILFGPALYRRRIRIFEKERLDTVSAPVRQIR